MKSFSARKKKKENKKNKDESKLHFRAVFPKQYSFKCHILLDVLLDESSKG